MGTTRLRQLASVAITASVLDVLLTYIALGTAIAVEANPIAARGMRTIGVGPLVVLDLVTRIGLVAMVAWIARRAPRPFIRSAAVGVCTAAAVWWTLVVVSNVSMIAMAGARA